MAQESATLKLAAKAPRIDPRLFQFQTFAIDENKFASGILPPLKKALS
jgi:hypothetical protein